MKSIFNRLEKLILVLSILCILFLLIVQFMSYDDKYSIYTSKINNKKKFIPFSNAENHKKGIIILKNMTPSYNEVDILINGDPVDNFQKEDEIQLYVYHNDVVEIDATKYNKNIIIKVAGISDNIEIPKLDTILNLYQTIEILSRVQLK